MNETLILNLTKDITLKIEKDASYRQKVLNKNLKIGSYLDPLEFDLDPLYSYKISGASSIEGCKYCAHINSTNSKKIYMTFRNKVKKRRVLGNTLTEKVRAIDIRTTLNKKA